MNDRLFDDVFDLEDARAAARDALLPPPPVRPKKAAPARKPKKVVECQVGKVDSGIIFIEPDGTKVWVP